ncbi:hypothetical protein ACB098_12G162500 [Castanea mollissima]
MFESSKQQPSIGGLISVPDHLRELNEQAFTPRLVSIGPIHRSNAKLQTMKKLKVQVCEWSIKRANIDLKNLVERIKAREKEIRSYYAETILSGINSGDFVTMILVDGMFILEFLRQYDLSFEVDDSRIRIREWMRPILRFDLVLLENQLPFFVLEMLFKQANFPAQLRLTPHSLKELAFEFFKCFRVQKMPPCRFDTQIEHFTDLVRYLYVSERAQQRGPGGAKLSYSASQLHEAGVKFKVVPKKYGRHFLDIRFSLKNGVLEIPRIKLDDEKIRLFRNIIALEQSYYVGHTYVTDFFVILDFLIDTSKDVDILCDKGILFNYLGDSTAAASAINNLNTNILWDNMNSDYWKICEELNAFYKKPWHRWRATLWRQYFCTPWRATSTSAAIILLVLTAIQTVCSLKSTKW